MFITDRSRQAPSETDAVLIAAVLAKAGAKAPITDVRE